MSPQSPLGTSVEDRTIAMVRGFAMDAPRAANNGHPGTAMALAPLADVLFNRVMRHDPADAHWPDRDRFVLSAGHASILLYSYLYLCGYGLTFRAICSSSSAMPLRKTTSNTPLPTSSAGQ